MSGADIAAKSRYFDDYSVGDVFEFGDYKVEKSELIAFAEAYDPQPFHIDENAAKETHFGGLITSGWHTCSMVMRLMVDHYVSEVAGLGSPGVDEIRWIVPVRPGDSLRVRVKVVETRASKSKPDRGIVRSEFEVFNQHDEIVMTMKSVGMMKRRP